MEFKHVKGRKYVFETDSFWIAKEVAVFTESIAGRAVYIEMGPDTRHYYVTTAPCGLKGWKVIEIIESK